VGTGKHDRRKRQGSEPPRPVSRDRRVPLIAAGAIALALALTSAFALVWPRGSASAGLRAIPRQNVLLITIDTLRADALHSYGGRAATPALDRLAAEGVRFDFAHAHAVLTLPSHASILTGTYPYQHGIRDNSGYRLSAGARTAATLLKASGYATGAFVAAFPLHSRFGLNAGFDVYDDRFGETRAPTEFVMPERPATSVVALARDWIARAGHAGSDGAARQDIAGAPRPWFAWVHVFEPHAPYRPPAPFDSQYERPYDGEVAATDAALAPLLDAVHDSDRSTLVIVTGDHGEALGDHGEETHGLFAYESTLRVPLIIAEVGGPNRRHAVPERGELSAVAARHIDILPTLLEAVGEPVPSDLAGRTLLPSEERRAGAPRPSYFEAMTAMLNRGWAPLTGILADRQKYIDVPIVERYDLAADRTESTNLAGRVPEQDRTLDAALRAFNAPLPGRRRAEEPEAAARLRSLGYVTGDAPVKARYMEADDPKTLLPIDQALHRGVELYSARRYDEAIKTYRGILDRRPDMAIAYRHLAFVAWETGQPRAAIEVLQRAIAAGVRHGGVLAQLGTYLAEAGNAAAAIPLLEPAAAGDAPDLDAVNALGIAYARAGRQADARRAFERMLTLDPVNGMALANLGALDLERGDLASARSRFERATEVDPTSSQAQSGLGVVSVRTGNTEAAVTAWKRAVELDPTNFDALYNLATTLARSGRMSEARPFLGQFVQTAPPAFYAKDIRELTAMLQRSQ
jgi:arylsulfatase A-like enzyme/tetratricopeptide (TPR) repeat protein